MSKKNKIKEMIVIDKRNATIDAMKIVAIYFLFGLFWFFGSNFLIGSIFQDPEVLRTFKAMKDILFLLTTTGVLGFIIYYGFRVYLKGMKQLEKNRIELESSLEKTVKLDAEIYELAYYDTLTKLPNKIVLQKAVDAYIGKKQEDGLIGFIYFDIDEFRSVNEVKGHSIGDVLLKEIADTLSKEIASPDMLVRISGDEFIIALFSLNQADKFLMRVEYYMELIRKSFILDKDEFFITYSAGVAVYPDHGKDYITLLRHADAAHSMAKQRGKDQVVIFDEEMIDMVKQKTQLANELRNAIGKLEFALHYQPIIELKENKIIGVEALIRWKHPIKGFIPPLEFISLAEKNGFIKEITQWVFKDAALNFKKWKTKGEPFFMSINLSAVMLMSKQFIPNINKWIKEFSIDCSKFTLEITETTIIEDIQRSVHILNQLRKLGFKIALDDFGTGYSSLTYLRKLPIDIIKIDRDFIADVKFDTDDFYILKYMIDLAHHLNLVVVAEGIETKEQNEMMKKSGVDNAQGYYYCRPMPQIRVLEYIKETQKNK